MRELLLAIQYIGIIGLFIEILVIFRRWKNRLQGYLFLNCVAVLVNNIGYLFELRSTNLDSYVTALQISYAGRVWVGFCLFLFVAELCHVRINEIIKTLLILSGVTVYAFILNLRSHSLYYTYMSFENDRIFPKLVHGNGIVHELLMSQQVVYIIFGIVWLLMSYKKQNNEKIKRRLFITLCAVITESSFFIVQIIGIPNITDVYDVTMIGYFLGTIILLVAIISFDLLGTSDIAKEFVIDRVSEGIIAVDNEGVIQYFNDPAKELYPRLENGSGNIPDDMLDAAKNKGSVTINDRIYDPQENELIYGGDSFGKLYVLVDETEHYHYMEELEEQKKIADRANEAKSIFLANMTHEIRTPINAVLGMDEMILRESRQEEILEYADNIKTAGTTLLGLVNDVLDMSKIESGKMDLIEGEYNIVSLINDISVMIDLRAEAKGLEYFAEIDPTIPKVLYGDDGHLKQIITNILTNAVKYTEKGSVKLCIQKLSSIEGTVRLLVKVDDTGIGIRKEDMPKLFAAFERIEEKRNRNIEGTGLGMSITTNLLDMMGNRLQCDSVYGEGSSFYFEIAQKIVENEPIGDYHAAVKKMYKERRANTHSFKAPDASVLVVDDTPMNLSVIKNLLKKTGINIDTAQSGMECLKKVTKKYYDIIFLDDRMPKLSGTETLSQMKQTIHPCVNTPVIAMTANSSSDAREHYQKEGFADYIAKPVVPGSLEELIIHYLPEEKVEIVCDEEQSEEPEEFRAEALDIYLDAISDNAAELNDFYNEKDWNNYTIKVHSIKSTSRIIGEEALSALAQQLENAGDQGDEAFITQNHELFINWYQSMLVKYRGMSDEYDSSGAEDAKTEAPDISENEVEEAFNTIRELASVFDDESIGTIIEMLDEHILPSNFVDEFGTIKKAYKQLDWAALCMTDTP